MPTTLLLFGRRLRAARVGLGYEIEDFAEELGLDADTYRALERGQAEPSIDTLAYVALLTEKSVDWFLTGRRSIIEASGD